MSTLQSKEKASAGRVSETVSAITAHIRNEELGPGDKLPSEALFSKELNVSRTVVREAYRSLAALHLIELNTGKRATVAQLDYASMSPLIEHGVHTEQISIQQVYDVRRTIEVRTAALASLRRTDEQARVILEHAVAMEDCFDTPEQMMEHDIAFHLEIAKAAKNPIYALIVGAFEGVTRQTWPTGWRSRTDINEQKKMLQIHRDLANAIAAGDPTKASDLMALHFDESVRALIAAGIS
ncbi:MULTISPECIES: FadR/GntR family transcriptional regulator [Halocynthiibacter]|uniref:FadR family transcriptional regulator n=1 Tax=Halocynthiibacter halioticoli TaxID=2986804 RepID=A0AAE3LTA9_9RHOB|nr:MULTISPECIES: FadR/GntR family transcriptional regulator [Halocynthiibacter]MCV6824816.1 FadR family transcriptional regulator [Halocynthiibacter halioticoli]MCW4057817.1 FadR family transcriptional regulator [Halocynthiibacter sp. SDUM655004]MDE0589143.1 FadR family transcriptional regulator [Halocynthiibacter sp. C4]